MFDRDLFLSRISTATTCPVDAIGVEVWGTGRDGATNEALERLVMNVDPQHGGGCWVVVAGARQKLPDPPTRCLGSASSTVDEAHVVYRAAAARYPTAPIWSPRWDCDALVAAMFLSGFCPRARGQLALAQLDALDSSASTSGIDRRLCDAVAAFDLRQHPEAFAFALGGGDAARAETVTDTVWGAVQALIRAGDFGGAVDTAAALLVGGGLPIAYDSVTTAETVARWIDEREACAAYVATHLETIGGVAHVHGAPLGAWAFALAGHDWAILSFAGRDGLAFSLAGSRRLPLARRSAVIAELNTRLTAIESAGAHWAGAAGLTGSRGRTTLTADTVAAVVCAVAAAWESR